MQGAVSRPRPWGGGRSCPALSVPLPQLDAALSIPLPGWMQVMVGPEEGRAPRGQSEGP